jgi:hypothetical protein
VAFLSALHPETVLTIKPLRWSVARPCDAASCHVRRTKNSHSRDRLYIREFGNRCVEVDAISANVIRQRVRDAILIHIDQREWAFLLAQEEREKVGVFDLVRRLAVA